MLKPTIRIVSLAGVVACYTYRPIEPAAAPPGTEVRARITGAASDRVAPLLGTFDTRILVGSVVENNDGAMTLEVPTGAMPNVSEAVVPLHARVPITRGDLVGLEQRRLDVGRTVLLSGGILAGVSAGVALALRSGASPDPGRLPTDPPPINRIPVLRIRF